MNRRSPCYSDRLTPRSSRSARSFLRPLARLFRMNEARSRIGTFTPSIFPSMRARQASCQALQAGPRKPPGPHRLARRCRHPEQPRCRDPRSRAALRARSAHALRRPGIAHRTGPARSGHRESPGPPASRDRVVPGASFDESACPPDGRLGAGALSSPRRIERVH